MSASGSISDQVASTTTAKHNLAALTQAIQSLNHTLTAAVATNASLAETLVLLLQQTIEVRATTSTHQHPPFPFLSVVARGATHFCIWFWCGLFVVFLSKGCECAYWGWIR